MNTLNPILIVNATSEGIPKELVLSVPVITYEEMTLDNFDGDDVITKIQENIIDTDPLYAVFTS